MTTLRFIQLTDLHLFDSPDKNLLGMNTTASLQAVLSLLLTLPQPDFYLLTGDLSQDATVASYQRLQQLLSQLSTPIYFIPGNHDHAVLMQQTLTTVPFQSKKHFCFSNWAFILLNPVILGEVRGKLEQNQLDFLNEQLRCYQHQHVVVALHHHPLPPKAAWMQEIGLQAPEAFQRIIQQHPQVKIVLWGHVHHPSDTHIQQQTWLSSPSTCIQFDGSSDQFKLSRAAPGLRWFALEDDGSFTTGIERALDFHFTLDSNAKGY